MAKRSKKVKLTKNKCSEALSDLTVITKQTQFVEDAYQPKRR